MAQARKATRNAVGGELSAQQVEAEFAAIRDRRQRINQAETLRAIKHYYEADDIEVTSKRVSLICPISKARVKVPVRSANCRHIECFDLRSYLHYHQRLTFWECPFSFCKAQARCDSLRVDDYMSEVLRVNDDSVQEVEVLADGSFKALQQPTPTETETIDDEDPYVPDNDAEPIVKTEENNESLVESMDTDAFPTGEDQPQSSSLTAHGEEQLREALRESRQQIETLRGELDSAKSRAEKAESDALQLRDDNDRLRKEHATKDYETRELTTANQKLQARLDAMEPVECGSLSKERDPHETSSTLTAGNDVDQAVTGRGPSAEEESQIERDDCSASVASISRVDLSESTEMESDSEGEEQPMHAPKPAKKKQKGPFTCAECGRVFHYRSKLSEHQRTHSGEKPYQCAQCGKAFAKSDTLRKHERIHTGEKPYKCGQCDKAFTRSSHLRRHERARHAVVKPSKAAKKTTAQARYPPDV